LQNRADDLNRLGAEFRLNGDGEAARLHYLAALEAAPGHLPALANLASVLADDNKLDAAFAIYQLLVQQAPHDPGLWNDFGNVATRLHRYPEAIAALDRAAQLAPESVAVWHNRALAAHRMGDAEKALEYIDRVIALGNASHAVLNDKAHILLKSGRDLPKALEFYEARWHIMPHLPPWDFHIPEWQGEDLGGKTILIHGEQGYGDTIMTARFVRNLQIAGAAPTFGIPKALCRLFEESFEVPCISIDSMDSEDLTGRFDFHSPLYSVMRWLEMDWELISSRPYLKPPQLVVPPVFGGAMNVGICWASGKRGGEMDWRRRHAPLDLWLRLASIPNIQLWSLQKDFAAEEIRELGVETLVRDRTATLGDWADTAAFVAKLDLVITVDTAIAHLAGALGKPVWMLSQYDNCWRWRDIRNGTGQPWYQSMCIYSQGIPGDWKGQLEEVEGDLQRAVHDWRRDFIESQGLAA